MIQALAQIAELLDSADILGEDENGEVYTIPADKLRSARAAFRKLVESTETILSAT